jgi:hypothetical protein
MAKARIKSQAVSFLVNKVAEVFSPALQCCYVSIITPMLHEHFSTIIAA